MGKFEELVTPYGSVYGPVFEFEGKEIRLTEQAYWEYNSGHEFYRARAIDAEGNQYDVFWEIKENSDEIMNEDEMCDWESPYEIKRNLF